MKLVAFAAELGQGDELKGIERQGRKSGADEVVVMDLRREFAEKICWPMLRAHAIYEQGLPAGHGHRAPADRRAKQVEIARAGQRRRRRATAPPARATIRYASSYVHGARRLKIVSAVEGMKF